jgi:molybdate-binding protein
MFCHKVVLLRKKGFLEKKRFNQENIEVLPRKDIGFANRQRFN